jgi:hypothetical protein
MNAFLLSRALLAKGKLSFSEAVEHEAYKAAIWESHGHPAWLNSHFKNDKFRLENDRLAIKVTTLSAAVTKLKEATALCPSCEIKRRWLASIAGFPILWMWIHIAAHGLSMSKVCLFGMLLAVSPITFTWCRWRFVNWRHRVDSKLARDNHNTRENATFGGGSHERF